MADATIQGADDLRRFLREFPMAAQRGAYKGMQAGTLRVQRAARSNLKPWEQGGGIDRGTLRQSIAAFVQYVVGGVRGMVGSNLTYAPHVEFGTRPHWPPKGALALWAKRHGVNEEAMRYAISLKGTRPRKFLSKAVADEMQNVVEDIVREVRAAVLGAAGK